jgi:putative phage-type endonuclease
VVSVSKHEPIVYKVNKAEDLDLWLELRRSGIGGSDVAAICGLNPWRGPLTVYLEKVGQAPDREYTEAMELGEWLEDSIAQLFAKRTGYKVTNPGVMLRHPKHPYMLATIDRWVEDDSGKPGVLECKNVGERMAKEWADGEVPPYYVVQVQHYLCVTGAYYGWIAPLIGGNRLKPVRVERDERLIAELIEIESEFWNMVVSHIPPAVDDSTDAERVLRFCYPTSTPGKLVELGEEEQRMVKKLRLAQDALKQIEAEVRLYKNQLIDFMKDAEAAYVPGEDRPAVTYKGSVTRRLDAGRLAAEHPDVAAPYYIESSTRRFLLKGQKHDED